MRTGAARWPVGERGAKMRRYARLALSVVLACGCLFFIWASWGTLHTAQPVDVGGARVLGGSVVELLLLAALCAWLAWRAFPPRRSPWDPPG